VSSVRPPFVADRDLQAERCRSPGVDDGRADQARQPVASVAHRRADALDLRKTSLSRCRRGAAAPLTPKPTRLATLRAGSTEALAPPWARAGARSSRERRARSTVRGRRGCRAGPSVSTRPAGRRYRRSSAGRGRPHGRQERRWPPFAPQRAACKGMPARR
jgi:hypothetical protein